MTLAFRRARADDLGAIVALLADDPIGRTRESNAAELDRRYAEAFAAIEKDPNQLLAVAERDGQVVGVLPAQLHPGADPKRHVARADRGGARRFRRARYRYRPGDDRMGDLANPASGAAVSCS